MTIFGYSLGRSLKDYGWAVTLAVALLALAWAAYAPNPVEEAEQAVGGVFASPASLRCPGWTVTEGRDPDGNLRTRTCTSPDKRYIITARDDDPPTGYDATKKRFMTQAEIDEVLK